MNILGIISVDVSGHPAACLLKDGRLIAFAEEERFVRVKQARGYFPGNSISFCLKSGNLSLNDIDYIAFGWDANLYRLKFPLFLGWSFIKNRLFRKQDVNFGKHATKRDRLGSAIISGINSLISFHPRTIKEKIILGLKEAEIIIKDRIPPIIFVNHHLAHAATAFYCSGFEESAILVFDGHGEENTVTIFRGEKERIRLLKKINIPDSLGWFYSMFTEYLGWDPNEGEVKLMGLAPFGHYNHKIKEIIDAILNITENGIRLDTNYMFYSGRRSYGRFFSDALVEKLGLPRGKNDEITQVHKDIAFAVQKRLEETGIHLAKLALRLAGSQNLCIAGGVALNCKMNGEIHKAGIAKNFFVQPIAYDAGTALGAAMVQAVEKGDDCRFVMDHLYWGPDYSDEEIEVVLKRNRLSYVRSDKIEQIAAGMLANGKIIGWFQGRLEAGLRALGGRSILADPRDPKMKDKVNNVAKFREDWRPFACSILEEHVADYLKKPVASPFMTMAFEVLDGKTTDMQSAMHWIDKTTRPQTVSKKTNLRFWRLIEEFRKMTGIPAILNTSFNVKGEPIVCTPEDAIRTFYGTGIDVLIIGDFIIEKV